MAVLEKIRVRMGVFISIIIGLSLILFIVDANTMSSVVSMFSSQNDVGKINGKTISYQNFMKRHDEFSHIQTMWMGGSSLDEETQERVREQTWQDFFNECAFSVQYEKCGIEVSAKELVDLTQGRYISPVLRNDPVFWGESRTFSRANVLNFIRSINSDASGGRALYWQYSENRMREVQLMEKYASLLMQSRYINALELKHSVANHNTTADISYIVQNIGGITDSLAISEAAIRDYYNQNKKMFEQETSRDMEFVAFEVTPSEEDIHQTKESIERIYNEFIDVPVSELDVFVSRNSDEPFAGYYYKKGELPATLDSFAFHATVKNVLPVYRDDNTFYTARIIKARTMPDSVEVRHILIQNQDKIAANKLVDSLIMVINNGANFGYIAQQYSADQTANRNEGSIGWFSQDANMVKAFRDTCFVTPKNKLIKVETQYGLHIIEVTNRSTESHKIQLAIVKKTSHAGRITYQNMFEKANNLASASNNRREQFENVAAEKGYSIIPGYSIKEGQKNVATLANAKDISRWVYEAKEDDVSSVLTVGNVFVVTSLVSIREEGIAPLAQVRSEIEVTLQREQKAERLAQRLKEYVSEATALEYVAEKAGLITNTATNVSFTGGSIPNIGFEPKLQGAVVAAKENTIIGPVKGNAGIYVFTVTSRTVGQAYTEDDITMNERYVNAQADYYNMYSTIQKWAKVVDNRGRFF